MSGRRTNQAMYRPISDCIVYFEGRHFYEPHDDEDRRRTEEREEDRGAEADKTTSGISITSFASAYVALAL